MAFYKRKYQKRGKKSTKLVRKTRKGVKPTRNFTKMVQKIVNKDVESKEAHYTYALTAYNKTTSNVGALAIRYF